MKIDLKILWFVGHYHEGIQELNAYEEENNRLLLTEWMELNIFNNVLLFDGSQLSLVVP